MSPKMPGADDDDIALAAVISCLEKRGGRLPCETERPVRKSLAIVSTCGSPVSTLENARSTRMIRRRDPRGLERQRTASHWRELARLRSNAELSAEDRVARESNASEVPHEKKPDLGLGGRPVQKSGDCLGAEQRIAEISAAPPATAEEAEKAGLIDAECLSSEAGLFFD